MGRCTPLVVIFDTNGKMPFATSINERNGPLLIENSAFGLVPKGYTSQVFLLSGNVNTPDMCHGVIFMRQLATMPIKFSITVIRLLGVFVLGECQHPNLCFGAIFLFELTENHV